MPTVAYSLRPENRHVDSAPRNCSGEDQDIRPDPSVEVPLHQRFLYQILDGALAERLEGRASEI